MPKRGDIVFFRSDGSIWDRLISFFSKAKHDIVHVSIYVDVDKTIEANISKRVGFATISEYKKNKHIIKSYKNITDEQRDKIIEYCMKNFGQKYDLLEILELFLKFFGININYNEKSMKVCSSLVWNAYNYAGITLTESEDSNPDELFVAKGLIEE